MLCQRSVPNDIALKSEYEVYKKILRFTKLATRAAVIQCRRENQEAKASGKVWWDAPSETTSLPSRN